VTLFAVRAAVDITLGLYRRRWRWASVADLERIALAVALGTLGTLVAIVSASLVRPSLISAVPLAFWPIELLITLVGFGGTRFAIRAWSHAAPRARTRPGAPVRTLLYGAGETGALIARWAIRTPGCEVLPVGFLDDDPALAGGLVADLTVHGDVSALAAAAQATGARLVLVTMPSAAGAVVRRVVDAALALGLEVRTVPALDELLDGSIDTWRVRQVRVEDLLRRPIAVERAGAVRELIAGRTILITGAAGSIGAELARHVHALGPRRLILVDRAESPLYLVERELADRAARGHGSGAIRVCLRNVASRAGIQRLMDEERPDVVLHAAAYKHVPMLEIHPSEAVQVNVGGTLAVLDAAAAAGVARFVLVSTDKAVRPSSAMGATKRIAELLVADAARRTGRGYVTVRFGNVLGSTGSVVPILQDELEQGRPLTITDPDMTRFFMTIPEAAWLILDAAALGRAGGDLFVLDMGEPVRILDLARDLVRLVGRDPDSQPIEIVGLRPGERLHEELAYPAEAIRPTDSPKVLRLVTAPPAEEIRTVAEQLLALADGRREPELRGLLIALANEPLTGRGPGRNVDLAEAVLAAPAPEPRSRARRARRHAPCPAPRSR
jgi:FlaA1/EpsC-like NDP-sugar epimerase